MSKELRRLRRKELVEVIYQQRLHADDLETQIKALKKQIEEADQRHETDLARAQEENRVHPEDIQQIHQAIQSVGESLANADKRYGGYLERAAEANAASLKPEDLDQVHQAIRSVEDLIAEADTRYGRYLERAEETNAARIQPDLEQVHQALRGVSESLTGINREIKEEYKERIAQLEQESKMLRSRLDARLEVQKVGSLADAVVGLSDIFANAQQAADQYVTELALRSKSADEILMQAKVRADIILREAEEKARACIEAAEVEIFQKQTEFQMQCKAMLQSQEALRKILQEF